MEAEAISLQDKFAPNLTCFGCGPMNEKGLQIKSFVQGDEVICNFKPQPHHQAYEGMINGGIIGALFDCHMNWTACWHLMNRTQVPIPPCTVTAKFGVEFFAPTPSETLLTLIAKVTEASDRQAVIEARMVFEKAGTETMTATGTGTFVAVKEGHPAYHRW